MYTTTRIHQCVHTGMTDLRFFALCRKFACLECEYAFGRLIIFSPTFYISCLQYFIRQNERPMHTYNTYTCTSKLNTVDITCILIFSLSFMSRLRPYTLKYCCSDEVEGHPEQTMRRLLERRRTSRMSTSSDDRKSTTKRTRSIM